jgi:glycosyltransferase involved in cell wall biosynthesis
MTAESPRISVCIVCRNEADKLPECLESVQWADEVIVMDLESTDGSGAVASGYGARVVVHPHVPIVELVRNVVAAEATGDWILALDPDERVSPGLAEQLRGVSRRTDVDVVTIPVMNFDFGHPASTGMHRYDPKPRMYRKGSILWPTEPNELPQLDAARVHHVPRADEFVLVHDRNRSIAEALERVLRYAPAEAEALLASGETFTARKMVRRATSKAYKQFVQARSLEEGVPGLVRAFILASFHFYVWACFWQLSGGKRTPEDDRYLRRLAMPLRLLEAALVAPNVVRSAARRLSRRG